MELTKRVTNSSNSKNKLLVLMYNCLPHTCSGSLIQCCSTKRCEVCHAQHLSSKHQEVKNTFWRMHQSNYIITGDTKPERKEKEKKQSSTPIPLDEDRFLEQAMKLGQKDLELFLQRISA